MRPVRLEIEGFTTFRQTTVVDFHDADLFALSGPTGSGKSSVIDAMIFALYGSIPRLTQGSVAPVISLGANEARVRLDFTASGVGYTAVRVVRRTKGGATTKEARLERAHDGAVLAGNRQELTHEVERLLGLPVGDFTKCVVLPQGAFQEFLHAAGKDRQDLLVKLLDLGIYDQMANSARRRERTASQQAEVEEALMAKLAFATPAERVAKAERVAVLTELRAAADAAGPELARLDEEARGARAEAQAAADRAERLGAVVVPAGLTELGARLAASQQRADIGLAEEEAASRRADQAQNALGALPARRPLEAALEAHDVLFAHTAQQVQAAELLGQRRVAEDEAQAQLAESETAQAEAERRLEQARRAHRAHDLASSLLPGEPCPVCQRPVAELPDLGGQAEEVSMAEAALSKARAGAKAAARAAVEAHGRHRELLAKLESIAAQVEQASARVAAWPDRSHTETALQAVVAAEEAERGHRAAAAAARKESLAARKAVDEVRAGETRARQRFNQARAHVSALGPRSCDGVELLADWQALARWASEQRPLQEAEAERASDRAASAASARSQLDEQLRQRYRTAGVELGRRNPGDAVADALAEASANLRRIDEALAEGTEHRRSAAEHRQTAQLTHELARHLSANHFEKWLLDEALAVLVEGATELLHDLSRGAYSLGLDPDSSNFTVIDHRNADQVRSARTLSGGETFLASLALALALADQLGSLAAHGSAHLESIFLDEGFGTLDPDTLDTVVSAIEELGARGRMVGLVSHVADLAERVPVRFDVRYEPGGSTITKVVA